MGLRGAISSPRGEPYNLTSQFGVVHISSLKVPRRLNRANGKISLKNAFPIELCHVPRTNWTRSQQVDQLVVLILFQNKVLATWKWVTFFWSGLQIGTLILASICIMSRITADESCSSSALTKGIILSILSRSLETTIRRGWSKTECNQKTLLENIINKALKVISLRLFVEEKITMK